MGEQTTLPSDRPDLLIFYRGEPLLVERVEGYPPEMKLTCPKCGVRGYIALFPVDPSGHSIIGELDGSVSIHPSLICGADCGWHVLVSHGEARDV